MDSSQAQVRRSKRSASQPGTHRKVQLVSKRYCGHAQTAAHFSQGSQASVSEVLEKSYSLLPAFVGSIDQDLHRQMRTKGGCPQRAT